jgi:transglutaminase-like putative cysteine protease
VEVDHPKIQAVAETLRAQDPMTTARRTFRWVADHVRDSGYLRDDRGALYALEHGRGDCTEHMYLFVALARANGIPARPMAGYIMEGNGVLRARDHHNWAEFYADGAWHIADPHRGVFDDGYSHYVATRIIGGASAAGFDPYRFPHAVDGLEVTMH